jgi:hypothetical protein
MSSIEAALAAIESLEPGENLYILKLLQSMVLIVGRSRGDTKAPQSHGTLRLKIYKRSTPSKSRSSYAI